MAYDLIQVGTGGRGGVWCGNILPPCVDAGLVDVVAAVDVDPDALENAREHLDLDPGDCYTDVETAFEEVDADCCTVVVPPEHHEAVVDAAIANDLHVLSEKPIADTLEASVRIATKVERAGLKMGVTMSHRFREDVTTLRRAIRSAEYGPVDYLVGRYSIAARDYGEWGRGRLYEMERHPLLVDGAVHHLDILADLAGASCETIAARSWNPEWSDFLGEANALVLMGFENGRQATYEGTNTVARGTNSWLNEYVRAECRDATLVLDQHELTAFPYEEGGPSVGGESETIPLEERPRWSDEWLVEQFVEWLDGGDAMATNVRDNLQSVAMVEAAIQSAENDETVHVQELLRSTEAEVDL